MKKLIFNIKLKLKPNNRGSLQRQVSSRSRVPGVSVFFILVVILSIFFAPLLSYSKKDSHEVHLSRTEVPDLFTHEPIDDHRIDQDADREHDEEENGNLSDPYDFDIVNYVRDDFELANRGAIVQDNEDLLFGTVEELDLNEKSVPPDMTFEEDFTQIFVTVGILNMRKLPSLHSEIIKTFSFGDSLVRTGIGAEWERVVDAQGRTGYMKREYVADTRPTPSPTPTKPPPAKANTFGESIALEAQKYLGVRYRHGVADPGRGFDCSGLTWYVYNRYGISTPRGTSSYGSAGTIIPYSQIMPGDVIAWNVWGGGRNSRIEHVGIYIGNGMMIHASSTNRAVVRVSVAQYQNWGCRIISVHRFSKD